MRHTFEAHSSNPNVVFTCIYCPQSFRKYRSLMSHCSHKHKNIQDEDGIDQQKQGSPSEQDDNMMDDNLQNENSEGDSLVLHQSTSTQNLEKTAALFLLTMKEKYHLTQAAIDFAVSQVQNMVSYALEDVQETVKHRISEIDDPASVIDT